MTYKIISPTGVSVTKSLSDEQVQKVQQLKYFTLVPMKIHVFMGDNVCTSCEG